MGCVGVRTGSIETEGKGLIESKKVYLLKSEYLTIFCRLHPEH